MIGILKPEERKDAYSLVAQLGYDISEAEFFKNIDYLEQQQAVVFIAKENTRVVGFIAARLSSGLMEGRFGEIIALVISDAHRRKGIGRQLVRKAEEWVFEREKKIRVRSNVVREEAHSFYRALGYTPSKTQHLYIKTPKTNK